MLSCVCSSLAAAALLLLTILYPSACSAAVQEGLSLCLTRAIPSLFPFFVVSCLTVRSGLADALARLAAPLMRVYRLPAAAVSALLLGFLGGYPTGAQTIAALTDSSRCSRSDANRLILFCNNTGPAFLVGLCGVGLFHSVRIGLTLYAIHLLSACLLGLLFRGDAHEDTMPLTIPSVPSFGTCLTQSILQAGQTALTVTSFILYFSVLLRLLRQIGLFSLFSSTLDAFCPLTPSTIEAILSGCLELTNGLTLLASCDAPAIVRLTACSALCAFGGVCVLFQSAAAAPFLSLKRIAAGKVLHAALCGMLTFLLFLFWIP